MDIKHHALEKDGLKEKIFSMYFLQTCAYVEYLSVKFQEGKEILFATVSQEGIVCSPSPNVVPPFLAKNFVRMAFFSSSKRRPNALLGMLPTASKKRNKTSFQKSKIHKKNIATKAINIGACPKSPRLKK